MGYGLSVMGVEGSSADFVLQVFGSAGLRGTSVRARSWLRITTDSADAADASSAVCLSASETSCLK